MDNESFPEPAALMSAAEARELMSCNDLSCRFGLTLSEGQAKSLAARRAQALSDTGRVEFGGGVLKKLACAFCDSPYISQEDYADTLAELQDTFYYYKNESEDTISDDELIAFMRKVYNGRAQGSLEYLAGTSLAELCRYARGGGGIGDTF